jgi:hypothetical protein
MVENLHDYGHYLLRIKLQLNQVNLQANERIFMGIINPPVLIQCIKCMKMADKLFSLIKDLKFNGK